MDRKGEEGESERERERKRSVASPRVEKKKKRTKSLVWVRGGIEERLKNSERHRARKGGSEGAGSGRETGTVKERDRGGRLARRRAGAREAESALKLVVKADRALL